MFIDCVPVGHPGDVVADRPFQTARWDRFLDVVWQDERLEPVGIEQICDDMFGLHLHAHHPVMPVEILEKEILQFPVSSLRFLAITDNIRR